MRSRIALAAAVLVAAALAVLLWLRVGRDRSDEQPRASAGSASGQAPGRPMSGGAAPGAGTGGLNVLLDDDPEGALRLEGIVLDAAEKPVVGAIVTVSSHPPRQTKSGDDGSFFFDKLVGRPYTLVARAPEGVAGPVTARLTAKSDPVTLRLTPASSVEVTVVGAVDRKPIAGATVELRDLETIDGKTDAEGKARLVGVAPGGYELVAWAPGYAKSHRFMGVARAADEKEEIALRRGAAVSGRVVGEGGKPVAGARVAYAGVSEWTQQADPRRDAVETDAEGRYRFEAVGAGTYRFAARHPEHAPGSSSQVTLDGQNEASGVDIVLTPGAVIAGKVVSKDGKPVASAAVRVAVRPEGGWSFEDARQTFAGEDGTFEMRGLPRKKLDVVALHETAASETVVVDAAAAAEKRDVLLTLELDGTIAGIVVDPAGEPIEGAEVRAMPDLKSGGAGRLGRMEWQLRGAAEAATDAGGRFAIVGLRPGDYQLRASRPTSMRAGWLRDPVDAKVGDQNVRIVLDADGGVKGQVRFADGTPPELFVVSLGRGMGGGTPFSGSGGKFELDGVPPGQHVLTISGPTFDRRQAQATIEAGKTADAGTITVEKGRTLTGRVLLPDGKPVPGANVYAARRLFGSGASAGGMGGMGPRGGGGQKTAVTDGDGGYVLYGIGPRDLAVVAEHETLGRSTTRMVAGSPQPATLDLVLQPFAALEGKITQSGRPAEGVGVNVTSQNVPNTNFMVQTGPDGAFRFDRLAPDTYLVQATSGRGPMMGMAFTTKVATVTAGQTARVSIDIPAGTASLTIKAQPKTAGATVNGMVNVALGQLGSTNAKALQYEMARLAPEDSRMAIMIASNPVTVDNLRAGTYTACIVPLPQEVRGMGPSMEYVEREGDNLPAFCVSKRLEGASQELSIPVTLPAYVPPPATGQGT